VTAIGCSSISRQIRHPIALLIHGHRDFVYEQYFALTIGTEAVVFYDKAFVPRFKIATIHTHLGRLAGAYSIEYASGTSIYELVSHATLPDGGLLQTEYFASKDLAEDDQNELGDLREFAANEIREFDLSELRENACAGHVPILPLTAYDHPQLSYASASALDFGVLAKQAEDVIGQLTEGEQAQVSRISPECSTLLRSKTLIEFVQSFFQSKHCFASEGHIAE
jgi:hypothetical protein